MPVSVPPEPTPTTTASRSPPICSRISGAVVASCARRVGRIGELVDVEGAGRPLGDRQRQVLIVVRVALADVGARDDHLGAERARRAGSSRATSCRARQGRCGSPCARRRAQARRRCCRPSPRRPCRLRFKRPSASAASIMARAGRSLIEPLGFADSSLRNSRHGPKSKRVTSTSGVLPMRSRTLVAGMRMSFCGQAGRI